MIQVNLNRSRAAQSLLEQTLREGDVCIALVSEPNQKIARANKWIMDQRGDTAIKIIEPNIRVQEVTEEERFSSVRLAGDILLYSCYVSPNIDDDSFLSCLEDLKASIRKANPQRLLIAGDFNAKSPSWGSEVEDRRGLLLCEWIEEMELVIANIGNTPTFEKQSRTSYIDVTFHSGNLRLQNWRVTDDENLSDHRSIRYEVSLYKPVNTYRKRQKGWKIGSDTDLGIFQDHFKREVERNSRGKTAEELHENITQACNRSFSKKKGTIKNHQPVYWWSEEIAEARRECILARRKAQRLNRRRGVSNETKETAQATYRALRTKLKREIEKAKRQAWDRLVEALDDDIWGNAYQIARKRFRTQRTFARTDEEQQREANKLFPTYPRTTWPHLNGHEQDPPPLTVEDLREAASQMKSGKAPGPDCIPATIIKAVINQEEQYILEVLNNNWRKRAFPSVWKAGRLVLLEKPKKDADAVQSYRPICLLNEMGKLYERIINKKLVEDIDKKGGLADNQFGFRKGRSAIDALQRVIDVAKLANTGALQRRDYCVLITLDVKNAFNSAPWRKIVRAMEKKNIDPHLIQTIRTYFTDRRLHVGDTSTMQVTCGVPQGSVLGPTLWNLFYDSVLRLEVPREEVLLVGYADDLAVLITTRTAEGVRELANSTIRKVMRWMKKNKLQLATEKTESVILAGRRSLKELYFKMGTTEVKTKEAVRYLGVILGHNMRLGDHVKYMKVKAQGIAKQLNMLMPNTSGPRSSKRKLFATVIHSVVLYAAPIWAAILKHQRYRRQVQQIQRPVLIRVCRAYRTTSDAALCVVAGIPPIHLLVEERVCVYQEGSPKLQRLLTESKWQREWNANTTTGQWTKTLIGQISKWKNRPYGELTYHLTQVLTGHGCFRSYLYKRGRAVSEECPYCGQRDDARHTVFQCPRWADQRRRMALSAERDINEENLVSCMISSEEKWTVFSENLIDIIKTKEEEERTIYAQ